MLTVLPECDVVVLGSFSGSVSTEPSKGIILLARFEVVVSFKNLEVGDQVIALSKVNPNLIPQFDLWKSREFDGSGLEWLFTSTNSAFKTV